MDILDIHTHHPVPQPQGVESICMHADTEGLVFMPSQRYSIGIHPWDTTAEITPEEWARLESLAAMPEVVAIGECGIDLTPHGGPLFRQILVFKRHVELSESLRKPLVIHDVKGHDIIAGARRDLAPTQPWVIHGFRRKPEVAEMLLRAGCYLSFGEQFNADTLRATPEDRVLAETDESPLDITEVIASLSAAYGKDLTPTIAENTMKILSKK